MQRLLPRLAPTRLPHGPLLDPDARTIARQLGTVFLAGGALTLLWLVVPHGDGSEAAVIAVAALIAVGIGVLMRSGAADTWPPRAFGGALFVATVLIAVAACASGSQASGFLFYFLWTPPYAFLYFSRRLAVTHTLVNVLAIGGVLAYQAADDQPVAADGFNAGLWLLGAGSVVAVSAFARTLTRSLRRLSEEHAAIARVSAAVAANAPSEVVFELVAKEACDLLGVDAAAVLRRAGPDRAVVVASAGENALEPGASLPLAGGESATARALRTRRSARVGPVDAGAITGDRDDDRRLTAASAPVLLRNSVWGAISAGAYGNRVLREDAERVLHRFADLARLAIANAESRRALERRAATDELTGLANHRAFHEQLAREVARADRTDGRLAVVMLDLDGFKDLNDTFGHVAGDEVLAEVGRRLRRVTRRGEVAGRVGGDEFGIILPGADRARALRAAERCRRAILDRPLPYDAPLTLSGGVEERAPGDTADALLRRADAALYWAKAHGKDTILAFDPRMLEAEQQAPRRADTGGRAQALVGLRALARVVDALDATDGEHSERVADMAERIARELGWPADRAALLREAALIHDVGKIAVPDGILSKPAPLTAAERETVRMHAEVGARIAAEVLREEQVRWIRSHHERPDGLGYPDRLTRDEIPEGALVLAVAEAWDALTSARRYRGPLDVPAALAELERVAGAQVEPRIVSALRRVVLGTPQVEEAARA